MIEPHGNLLVSFPFSEDELQEYSELSNNISSLTLSLKQQCDLEMISNGAFSPLVTFNNQKDYEEILNNNNLLNGTIWPIPIVLDVPDNFLKVLDKNEYISLRNSEGFLLAILKTQELWSPNKQDEAYSVFGTIDHNHPAVHFTRVKCNQHIIKHYPKNSVELSLINLAMRMAGPKEALWHAIIRKNYGCNHIIVGRDHAGPGLDAEGKLYYQPYDAQELISQYQEELEIKMVPFQEMVFAKNKKTYLPLDKIKENEQIERLSGTEFKKLLKERTEIPNWYSFPEVIHELRRRYPTLQNQGLTVFFTGLSGAGKSTLANALMYKLMEMEDRPITLLDGDVVRQHLSSELGFSKEDRDIHVKRIGYVASEITKHGGVAICAPIAPYSNTRRIVRNMIDQVGSFVEIHVSTPLSVCEERDVKGLYKRARAGKILEFTGISDPYEEPVNPEIIIDTSKVSVEESSEIILDNLRSMKLLG